MKLKIITRRPDRCNKVLTLFGNKDILNYDAKRIFSIGDKIFILLKKKGNKNAKAKRKAINIFRKQRQQD